MDEWKVENMKNFKGIKKLKGKTKKEKIKVIKIKCLSWLTRVVAAQIKELIK
jgi:hypothetical protein